MPRVGQVFSAGKTDERPSERLRDWGVPPRRLPVGHCTGRYVLWSKKLIQSFNQCLYCHCGSRDRHLFIVTHRSYFGKYRVRKSEIDEDETGKTVETVLCNDCCAALFPQKRPPEVCCDA
jgi:hypothetical protein